MLKFIVDRGGGDKLIMMVPISSILYILDAIFTASQFNLTVGPTVKRKMRHIAMPMPCIPEPTLESLYVDLSKTLAAVIEHPDCHPAVVNEAYSFIYQVFTIASERDRKQALANACRMSLPGYFAILSKSVSVVFAFGLVST